MTDERFDDLTKRVSTSTTRRGLLKGAAALALSGLATRLRGGEAAARARVRMACARLGQPCSTVKGTTGSLICCPHLACDSDHICCMPHNSSCLADDECCGDDICRPNPTGLGNRCLPPGVLGAACIEATDCAAGLTCEPTTSTCLGTLGYPCAVAADCAANLRCDPYTQTCVACVPADAACALNSECCSNICNDVTGLCEATCLAVGATCGEDNDCCWGACNWFGSVCLPATPCQTGSDTVSGASWTVCRADFDSAWVSSSNGSGGNYHALQICQLLGYSTLGQSGGNCGNECGYCQSATSCSAPGAEHYDNGASCGSDALGPILCNGVVWECLA
jgi:hypothetical protein